MKNVPGTFDKSKKPTEVSKQSTAPAPSLAKRHRLPQVTAGDHLSQSVLGHSVKYTLEIIPADQVENLTTVWRHNERRQEHLNEHTLADILPSLIADGQEQPAKGRKVNGIIEFADGSRRRMATIIAGLPLAVWVGDLNDAQMDHVSTVGNLYKPTSAYERGKRYQRLMNEQAVSSLNALAKSEKISRKVITRCIKTASLPDVVVNCFSELNDLSARMGEIIHSAIWPHGYKDNAESPHVINAANDLIQDINVNGHTREPDEILAALLTKPTQTSDKPPEPKKWRLAVNPTKGTAKIDICIDNSELLEKLNNSKADPILLEQLQLAIVRVIDGWEV